MISEVDGILVAAQELKAPLAVIRQLALGLTEMEENNEQMRWEMVQVSERALRQVNDLAKIRKLEEGLFAMEPVAVREVCDEVTRELRRSYVDTGRKIGIKYRNRERLVCANRELLISIIYNFMQNALQLTNDNEKTEVLVGDRKGRVVVEVRDFGPGLSTKLWRELKNGGLGRPEPLTMRPGSSGLGLYIAAKFARYMQANLGAIRHRDGASFYVELLVSKQASLFG